MNLRPYQRAAIEMLYAWFERHETGNPCVVMPTGSGKSIVIAELCRDALQKWPETRVLMLTHQKELIEQNAEKLRALWPDAPLGIYSASIGRRQLDQITFAGIQSVRSRAKDIGHVDLAIIDECFVAGTKIATPSGFIDIDKVRCGDVVFNQAGTGIVQAISCKPADDTYLVELDDGRRIECTRNHLFFTEEGWRAAGNLASGSYLLGLEDMSGLWHSIQALDQESSGRENQISNAGASVEKAKVLLCEVCQEITPNGIGRASAKENKQSTQRDQAFSYSARRERAIAAFAAISVAACPRRWMDGRIFNKDECRTSERNISERIQSGYCQSSFDDCDRAGRRIALNIAEARAGSQENSMLGGARVVSVSRIERESPELVFNLQVSGHPSYFANGIAVHNCHLVSHANVGSYRRLLDDLLAINPALRVIGLTATPYRLGHGLITDAPALFDDLIEPTDVRELIKAGHLAPLKSKHTELTYDTAGIHKRGGDFIESELSERVNTTAQNVSVVEEIILRGRERKTWLIFCAGVDHAYAVSEQIRACGISCDTVTGETAKADRERMLEEFKAGRLRALTNANCLTTGVDVPGIDLVAMLRPTASPGLYVQMAGRGLRIAPGKTDCLILDFAGVVAMHGPLTDVQMPQPGKPTGEAPVKACPECHELIHLSFMVCPECSYEFPERDRTRWLKLHTDDILGTSERRMDVARWIWRRHVSRASGAAMLRVTYYARAISDEPLTEYYPVMHDGYAGRKAREELARILWQTKPENMHLDSFDLDVIGRALNDARPPRRLFYKRNGKFDRVHRREW